MPADVTDAAQRRAVYAAAGRAPALLITEGLLMYLPAATVEALCAESWKDSGIAHWMADITTTAFARAIQMDRADFRRLQAPDYLEGEQILEVVSRHGWVTESRRSYLTDMAFAMSRIQRLMGGRAQPTEPPPVPPDDPTGVQLWVRPR